MKLSSQLIKIEEAIRSKFIASIKYHDVIREVETHILGYNFDNEPIIRVYELKRGKLETNIFKTYLLSDIKSFTISKNHFTQSVTKKTDEAMKKILFTTYQKNGSKKEEE